MFYIRLAQKLTLRQNTRASCLRAIVDVVMLLVSAHTHYLVFIWVNSQQLNSGG